MPAFRRWCRSLNSTGASIIINRHRDICLGQFVDVYRRPGTCDPYGSLCTDTQPGPAEVVECTTMRPPLAALTR